ncbi:MAG: hypothetical protein ABSF94_09245 [Steroidobacteraceae bacterium]|jgi:hypothetical protein
MAFHQNVQRLLLLGVRLESPAQGPPPQPPPRLQPLIAAVAPAHRQFDERAVHFGHRYRSGFWSIYLLSAVAVLCAILPLALGWDSHLHALHPYAGLWAVAEVCVIGTVSAIYRLGHKHDWQGEWLRARTTAELTWYLPLMAPLVDFGQTGSEPNWYLRVFDPGRHPIAADEVAKICTLNESLARTALDGAWEDAAFVTGYAQWTIEILEEQRRYHHRIASKQEALLHRVHGINIWLFGLTALGALTHLLVHTLWLSLITTFFPALGASLHGALAQSEAYRLRVTSARLVVELQSAVDRIRHALDAVHDATRAASIKATIEEALELILEEHQDWQMLVRPHHLPLA